MQVFHGHGGSVKSVSCRPADRHLSLSLSLSPNPNPNPNPDPNPNPNPNPNQVSCRPGDRHVFASGGRDGSVTAQNPPYP